jgi:hypothetical protein
MSAIANDIEDMSECLKSKISSNEHLPNAIHYSQENIRDLNDQIAQEEANASIARDRVAYIRHPERHVSNYESWFPIDRPIHTFSLIIIMSMTVFLGTFILLVLLSMGGVNVIFYTESSARYNTNYTWILEQITPFSVTILIALIGVIVYYNQRK